MSDTLTTSISVLHNMVAGLPATRLHACRLEFPTREEAKAAEAQLKKWSRRKKEALIEGKIEELKVAARKDWQAYRERRGKEK
jgi:predicted GIY-YIG superfamily endonuclease